MADAAPEVLLHQILAAPLAAVVRAQTIAAAAFLDVVTTIGFADGGGEPAKGATLDVGALRMIGFEYERQAPDGSTVPMTMQLPVLSLIPMPAVEAKESTFSFDLTITSVSAAAKEDAPESMAELPEAELAVALPAAGGAMPEGAQARPTMSIQMTVGPSDLPGGVLNLLHTVNSATIVESRER